MYIVTVSSVNAVVDYYQNTTLVLIVKALYLIVYQENELEVVLIYGCVFLKNGNRYNL